MPDGEMIDRQSPTPYYQQLSSILEQRMASGAIAVGNRLPSEQELGREFGLARATVRQALKSLEDAGVVQRVANRGVFATKPTVHKGWIIQGPEGFLENAARDRNRSVTTRVMRSGEVELPEEVSRSLDLEAGSEGFELVRVRSLDGAPAIYSVNYSPPGLTATIIESEGVLSGRESLSSVLASAGYVLGGADRIIHAALPPAEVASALEIGRSTPLLRIRSVSWTRTQLKYDYYETWVDSAVIPLEVTVDTSDGTP